MATKEITTTSGNGLKLIMAWGFAGIPLAWGVTQTLANAVKAFQ